MKKLPANDGFVINTIANTYYPVDGGREPDTYRVYVDGAEEGEDYSISREGDEIVITATGHVWKCDNYIELAETLKQFYFIDKKEGKKKGARD